MLPWKTSDLSQKHKVGYDNFNIIGPHNPIVVGITRRCDFV